MMMRTAGKSVTAAVVVFTAMLWSAPMASAELMEVGDFRNLLVDYFVAAELGLQEQLNSGKHDESTQQQLIWGLNAVRDGMTKLLESDDKEVFVVMTQLESAIDALQSAVPFFNALHEVPELDPATLKSILSDCGGPPSDPIGVYPPTRAGERDCWGVDIGLETGWQGVPCIEAISCGVKIGLLAGWATNKAFCYNIEKFHNEFGDCVLNNSSTVLETKASQASVDVVDTKIGSPVPDLTGEINENQALLMGIADGIEENRKAIEELRVILCDVERLLHTPQGQRSSDCENCADQPGFPYNWPEGAGAGQNSQPQAHLKPAQPKQAPSTGLRGWFDRLFGGS